MNNNHKIDIFALKFKYLESESLVEDFKGLKITDSKDRSYLIYQCTLNILQSKYIDIEKNPTLFFEVLKKLKIDEKDLSLLILNKDPNCVFSANNFYKEFYYNNYKNEIISQSIKLENFEQLVSSVKIAKELLEVIKNQIDSPDNYSDSLNRYIDIYTQVKCLKNSKEEKLDFIGFFINYFEVNDKNIERAMKKLTINNFEKFYTDLSYVSKNLNIFMLEKENMCKVLLRNNKILENILENDKISFYEKLLNKEELNNNSIPILQSKILEKCFLVDEDSEYIISLIKNKKLKIPEKLNSLFISTKLSQELSNKNTFKSSIKL